MHLPAAEQRINMLTNSCSCNNKKKFANATLPEKRRPCANNLMGIGEIQTWGYEGFFGLNLHANCSTLVWTLKCSKSSALARHKVTLL